MRFTDFFEEIVRSCEGRFLILRSWLNSFTCLYYTIPRKLSRKLNFISVLGSWEKNRKFYTFLLLTWNSQFWMISGMQNVPQISCYRVYLEILVFDCCSRIGALWKVLKDLTYIDQLLYKISLVYFRFLKWIQKRHWGFEDWGFAALRICLKCRLNLLTDNYFLRIELVS